MNPRRERLPSGAARLEAERGSGRAGRVPRCPVVRLLLRWAISSAAAGAPAPAALIEVQTVGGRFT